MTTKTVAKFNITYKQILNEKGILVDTLPKFAESKSELLEMYKMMNLVRAFDTKAIALQRTGIIGTYPSTLGQEAISVAIGAAMSSKDVLCPYYRELGAQFWRGVKMEEILAIWGGDEEGNNYQSENAKEDLPICVPIASQNLHAVGVGFAMKYRKQKRAAVATVGEGGTSRGDFYEAMNVAGVWNLPVVFVVNNNQWAISVPRSEQTKAETFAQKGIACGVPGVQVDGNDIIAVKEVISNALKKAYEGKGPSVIEAITYRMCDHTTADDATRYRSESEVLDNKTKDPILRLKNYLTSLNVWDEEKELALHKENADKVTEAVNNYLKLSKKSPTIMFDYLYEKLPDAYFEQREEVACLEILSQLKKEEECIDG